MAERKLTAEQERLLNLIKQYNGKCPMTVVWGAGFSGHTINALKKKNLIEDAYMGGWYLLKENKEVSNG